MIANKVSRMRRLVLFLLFLSAPVLFPPPGATAPSPQEIVRRMQESYRNIDSFSANFSQTTSIPGRKTKSARGTAQFLRPSFIRWDYSEPERQIFINDGSTLTVYQEKNRQMLVSPVTATDEDLTLLFFSASTELGKRFELRPVALRDVTLDGTAAHAVELTPKTIHNQVNTIVVVCDKNFHIIRMRLVDHFESVTEIVFSATKLKTMQSSSPEERRRLILNRFSFTPPPDTEIIQQGQ